VSQTVQQQDEHPAVVEKLSLLDRLLPVSIGIAMATGLLLGRFVPGLNADLNRVQVDGISLPIALGLLIMMYPVLAKVRYDRLDTVTGDRKLLLSSLLLNWLVGPALMFVLATAARSARVPHRTDHRRPGQMYCNGDHLERPGLR
jgi:ACR3 family arsenite transporter